MNAEEYFNSIATEWNHIRSEYFEEQLKFEIINDVIIKDKICADLGCGTGFISIPVAKEGKLVFSIDISRNMLKQIKKEAEKAELNNIFPLEASMEKLPIFDDTIDVVFTNMALHHVEDTEKAIREVYRTLVNGGTLVISDVEIHNGKWAIEEMHDKWLGFSHEQIEGWLLAAGFAKAEVRSTKLKCKGYSSKGEYTETAIFIAKGIKDS